MAKGLLSQSLLSDASLVAYYRLEDVNDTTPNAKTLTNNGTSTFVPGKFGNGVNVNGSNQYLSRADNFGITWASAMTMCGWVRLNAEIGVGTWVLLNLNHENPGGTTSLLRYEFNAGTRRLKYVRYNSSLQDDEPLYNLTMGTTAWYHLAVTYNGSNLMTMYVNGASVITNASANTAGTGTTYPLAFDIGGDATGTTTTNAVFDDVAVFSRALTAQEIFAIYSPTPAMNNYQFVSAGDGISVSEKLR